MDKNVFIKEPHGGNIYKASEQFGIKKEDLLDFSANLNALGVPRSLKQYIIDNLDELKNYPDPDCLQLARSLENYLDVPADMIVAGNGASEILFLLFDVLKPKKVLIPAPTFIEYSIAARQSGAEVKYMELREKDGFRLDAGKLTGAIEPGVEVVFLCNPNNPTSATYPRNELEQALEYCIKKKILLVIDETFIELTDDPAGYSMVSRIKGCDNLFLLRAFTKLFAIPGLRLGYGIGNEDLITDMAERKLPWSVNTFACNAGDVLLKDVEYLEKTRQWLLEEKEYLFNELSGFWWMKPFKPETNFILVRLLTEKYSAGSLRVELAGKGILIRDASNFMFLNDRFIRLAVKDRKSNEKLISVLRTIQC